MPDYQGCPLLSTSVGSIAVTILLLLLLLVVILCFVPLIVLDRGAAIQRSRCPGLALLIGILVLLPPSRLQIAFSQLIAIPTPHLMATTSSNTDCVRTRCAAIAVQQLHPNAIANGTHSCTLGRHGCCS
jgi:hypothetical protein